MRKYIGIVTVTVDGETLDSLPGAKLDTGGVSRREVVGDQRIGFAEQRKPASVECEISFSSQTQAERLNKADDATVVFAADTGQRFVLREAWLTEPVIITGGEGGKVPVKFMADGSEPM